LIQTKNLDQSLENLKTTATEVGAILGKFTVTPALNNLIGAGNLGASLIQKIGANDGDARNAGQVIGQGILKGIGNVLSGPGLVVATRIFAGVIGRTVPEVFSELKRAGGFGGVKAQDQAVLTGINKTLALATAEEQNRFKAAASVAEQEQIIANILIRQLKLITDIRQQSAGLMAGIGAGELRSSWPVLAGRLGVICPRWTQKGRQSQWAWVGLQPLPFLYTYLM
jgi:hypothetical protein